MTPRYNTRSGALLAVILSVASIMGVNGAAAKFASGQHAEIKFSASQMNVAVDGEFKKFSADVEFDPAAPTVGKVNVVIDAATADTGSQDADELLKGKDFLDVAHFPRATFASSSITAAGAGKFLANGQFTLKGRSLPLVIPFKVRAESAGTWFEGGMPLSRLAYKVGEGEWADTGTISDQVQIRFKIFVPK